MESDGVFILACPLNVTVSCEKSGAGKKTAAALWKICLPNDDDFAEVVTGQIESQRGEGAKQVLNGPVGKVASHFAHTASGNLQGVLGADAVLVKRHGLVQRAGAEKGQQVPPWLAQPMQA